MALALEEHDRRMTRADFHAVVETIRDDYKWELLDGELVVSPAPTGWHELIVANIITWLHNERRRRSASWFVSAGVGIYNPNDLNNQLIPDVMVVPSLMPPDTNELTDILVAVEVLSRTSARRDLIRKREVYAAMPLLQDYLVVSQDRCEVHHFSRDNDFEAERMIGPSETVRMNGIGIDLPLAEIYRDLPLG